MSDQPTLADALKASLRQHSTTGICTLAPDRPHADVGICRVCLEDGLFDAVLAHEHDGTWVDHSHPGSFDWEYLVCACGAYALLDDDGLPGDWQAPDGTYKPLAVRDGI